MKKILPLLFLLAACQKSDDKPAGDTAEYENTPQLTTITGGAISEASGITDSKSNSGYLWVQEDSGNPPVLTLLKHDGAIGATILVEDATNRDWEDIVLSTGPTDGQNYLYIGDIGDNNLAYPSYTFYRCIEPAAGVDKVASEKIDFQYPDGSHDAEAFLVDPVSKDIYIITKNDTKSKVYVLAYPQSVGSMNTAVFIADLTFTGAVSAALAADGRQMIIKTYTTLNYWVKLNGESVLQAFSRPPRELGYKLEAQGESVSFAVDGSGFYTLSEDALGVVPKLQFYKKK